RESLLLRDPLPYGSRNLNQNRKNRMASSSSSRKFAAASSPFDVQDADVILTSSDGVEFTFYKNILRLTSPVFADMFSVCESTPYLLQHLSESGDRSQSPPAQVSVSETSQTLRTVLEYIYPIGKSSLVDLAHITDVLEAARKYQLICVTQPLTTALNGHLNTTPLKVFAIACRLEMELVARNAAQYAISVNIPGQGPIQLRSRDGPYLRWHLLSLILDLPESGSTLHVLLRSIYGFPLFEMLHPARALFHIIDVVHAARKYGMTRTIEQARAFFRSVLPDHPLSAYYLSIALGWTEEAKRAAKLVVSDDTLDVQASYVLDMEDVGAKACFNLLKYDAAVKAAVSVVAKKYANRTLGITYYSGNNGRYASPPANHVSWEYRDTQKMLAAIVKRELAKEQLGPFSTNLLHESRLMEAELQTAVDQVEIELV
ncbi:hypothetical protein EIP91_006665, partial [Steccherinum ochraceum]